MYVYQMCNMYNICKQNAENIRETRNFVLKQHRNTYTKLCKNDILGTYITEQKQRVTHLHSKFYCIFTLNRAFQFVHKSKKI